MCLPESLRDRSCEADPGAPYEDQPIGGTRLLEANLEFRIAMGFVEGVLFTDVGQAWGPDQSILLQDMEFTPGIGVRFPSPVGPVRLDLAYRFRGAEYLPVVTERILPWEMAGDLGDKLVVDGKLVPWVSTSELVQLGSPVLFGADDRGFQLHVSIGQAF